MRRIADTSFLYAAFDAADARHRQARDEISKPQPLEIPLCVMAEFLDLLEYRHDRETSSQVHKDLTDLGTVALLGLKDEPNVVNVWAKHRGLSMVDAAGVVACLENKGTLLSYDSEQIQTLASLATRAGS